MSIIGGGADGPTEDEGAVEGTLKKVGCPLEEEAAMWTVCSILRSWCGCSSWPWEGSRWEGARSPPASPPPSSPSSPVRVLRLPSSPCGAADPRREDGTEVFGPCCSCGGSCLW